MCECHHTRAHTRAHLLKALPPCLSFPLATLLAIISFCALAVATLLVSDMSMLLWSFYLLRPIISYPSFWMFKPSCFILIASTLATVG